MHQIRREKRPDNNIRSDSSRLIMNHDGADAESPFLLFFSFSASFKNSSPREKVGNCLCFGTGGPSVSVCIHYCREIYYFSPC